MTVRPQHRWEKVGAAVVAVAWLVGAAGCSAGTTPSPSSPATGSVVGSGPSCPMSAQRRDAVAAKVSAALATQLELALGTGYPDLRAVLVDVCGERVYEEYRSTTADDTQEVASVAKSVVGTLVGLALADGSLTSLDQTLAELLPQHRGAMSADVASIRLREMLTMTAGLDADLADGSVGSWIDTDRFVDAILRAGISATRGEFHYSSATSHVLSAIVATATGKPVLDYATEKLFGPLGIDTTGAAQPVMVEANLPVYEKAGFAWAVDHQGISFGGGWLKLRPGDMARLGQTYLDQGRWQGRQVVPAEWVRAATTPQVPAAGGGGEHYGYQWWVTTAGDHPAFAATGFGGQLIEVVPAKSLVAVFATSFDVKSPSQRVSAQTYENLVSFAIIPALS